MQQLHALLSAQRKAAVTHMTHMTHVTHMTHMTHVTHAYALRGLGGIGKTQVALEYAYRHAQDYSAVYWLGAETREALLTDVAAMAALLELPNRAEADQTRLLAAFTRWLASQRDCLLTLDTLEAPEVAQELLPPTWHGAVLLTTLLTTYWQALGALAQPVEVGRLPTEEGVQLLLQRARRLAPEHEPVLAAEMALARPNVRKLYPRCSLRVYAASRKESWLSPPRTSRRCTTPCPG